MTRQLEAAAYVHAIMFTSEPLEQYAAALAEIVPLPDARFYFLSSGCEVVEAAIKLARQIQMARGDRLVPAYLSFYVRAEDDNALRRQVNHVESLLLQNGLLLDRVDIDGQRRHVFRARRSAGGKEPIR